MSGGTAEDGVGAAAEHRVHAVLAAGDRPEEERLLRPGGRRDAGLARVRVVLGRLHERNALVAEVAERRCKEALGRHVVAVSPGG